MKGFGFYKLPLALASGQFVPEFLALAKSSG
jgi:hypothetical protein